MGDEGLRGHAAGGEVEESEGLVGAAACDLLTVLGLLLARNLAQAVSMVDTSDQAQPSTGASKSIAALPSLWPCSFTWYILTFLSHDETARKSACGENARPDMLSSGGCTKATSFETSPVVLEAAVVEAALPNRPDILPGIDRFQMRLARCYGSGLTILEMCKLFDINKSPYVRQELLKADATVHAIHLPAEESRKSNLKLPSLMYGDASDAKVAIRRSTCSGSVRSIRLAGQQEGFQSRKYSSIHILKRVEIAGDQDRPVSLCNGGN